MKKKEKEKTWPRVHDENHACNNKKLNQRGVFPTVLGEGKKTHTHTQKVLPGTSIVAHASSMTVSYRTPIKNLEFSTPPKGNSGVPRGGDPAPTAERGSKDYPPDECYYGGATFRPKRFLNDGAP